MAAEIFRLELIFQVRHNYYCVLKPDLISFTVVLVELPLNQMIRKYISVC